MNNVLRRFTVKKVEGVYSHRKSTLSSNRSIIINQGSFLRRNTKTKDPHEKQKVPISSEEISDLIEGAKKRQEKTNEVEHSEYPTYGKKLLQSKFQRRNRTY